MLPPFGKGRINFEPSAMLTLPVVLLSVTLVKKKKKIIIIILEII